MAKYFYEPGAVRWIRHTGNSDVRAYRAPKGWSVEAMLLYYHPVTDALFVAPQWWIRERYKGD